MGGRCVSKNGVMWHLCVLQPGGQRPDRPEDAADAIEIGGDVRGWTVAAAFCGVGRCVRRGALRGGGLGPSEARPRLRAADKTQHGHRATERSPQLGDGVDGSGRGLPARNEFAHGGLLPSALLLHVGAALYGANDRAVSAAGEGGTGGEKGEHEPLGDRMQRLRHTAERVKGGGDEGQCVPSEHGHPDDRGRWTQRQGTDDRKGRLVRPILIPVHCVDIPEGFKHGLTHCASQFSHEIQQHRTILGMGEQQRKTGAPLHADGERHPRNDVSFLRGSDQ